MKEALACEYHIVCTIFVFTIQEIFVVHLKKYDACRSLLRNKSKYLWSYLLESCHHILKSAIFLGKKNCDYLQALYLCVVVAGVRERLPPRHEKVFIPFQLLLAATNHFHESNVVGEGGFGKVYKGTNTNGDIWAVKRSKYVSREVKMEFEVEVSKCTLY